MSGAARPRLAVVGTGIRFAGQLTVETRNLIANADRVFAVMADTLSLQWLKDLNANTVSLQGHYAVGKQRDETYRAMVESVLQALAGGESVTCAFYGHPGVFVWPSHAMVRQARALGYPAHMYPAISAEDCLFADLGLDPARSGCQSYEAMDFLLYPRAVEPSAALIIWQVAALGDHQRRSFESQSSWVASLVEVLAHWYPTEHVVTLYDAAIGPLDEARMDKLALGQLPHAELRPTTTLYVPPLHAPRLSATRLQALGVDADQIASSNYQLERDMTGKPEP